MSDEEAAVTGYTDGAAVTCSVGAGGTTYRRYSFSTSYDESAASCGMAAPGQLTVSDDVDEGAGTCGICGTVCSS